MFGTTEEIARTLMKERMQAIECKGEYREWCINEYRRVNRCG
jgi:hypothetical protein